MFLRLFLLLTIVPLLELAILLWLHDLTSWQITLAYVVLTGLAGAWLARLQGAWTWRKIHEELAAGRMPSDSLLDALMILIAGALLVTPGMLTDLVGFLLLWAPFRNAAKKRLLAWFSSRVTIRTVGMHPSRNNGENVIDAEVVHTSRDNDED